MGAGLTPTKVRNLNAYVEARVGRARQRAVTRWQGVARRANPTIGRGLYAAMDDLPPMERKGPNGYKFAEAAATVYELNSSKVGLGLKMDADQVKDDLYGIYNGKMDLLGQRMAKWPDKGVFKLIQEGDTTKLSGRDITWLDGLSFFNTAHKLNPNDASVGTFSNLTLATALTAANFTTAYQKFVELKDTQGEVMGLYPNRLIVPPALWDAAATILEAPTVATGGFNVQSNEGLQKMGFPTIMPVVVPELAADTGIWYLAYVDGDMAPVIFQETETLQIVPKIDPQTDDNVIFDDELIWVVKGRSEFGWGDPRLIMRFEA